MPRGANWKREREYEKLKEEFHEEGRYPGREEEVASRIVNKQRRKFGETKDAQEKDRQGKSPDRGLPIKDHEHLTVDQVKSHLGELSHQQLEQVEKYKQQHRQRKTLLEQLERALRRSGS